MIQIPKGSVHIDIRELNLSINYLGEEGWGMLKSQPDAGSRLLSFLLSSFSVLCMMCTNQRRVGGVLEFPDCAPQDSSMGSEVLQVN